VKFKSIVQTLVCS